MDREDVIERVNWSPRAGVSVGVLPEGRGILRGGVGKFRQRTPLNVGAFADFESRVETRFGPDGEPLGPPVTFVNIPAPDLRTPEAVAGNIEWNQRFGRRVLFKANYLRRKGSHEYILEPDASRGEVRLIEHGHVALLGGRAHGPLSRERAAGPDRLVRAVAWHGGSEQLRSVLRQSSQPDRACERAQSDSHRRAASA